jgi:rhamnulokinase
MEYYLAIDIGASSGRHILGWLEDGGLRCEEIHRFPNGAIKKNGRLCWDSDAQFSEVLRGLKKCADLNKIPVSLGINTWGVDYALLDADGKLADDTVAYRDGRTADMDTTVYACMPKAELYRRTGIQEQPYNTIFQLMAAKTQTPEIFAKAETLLMMPDYLHYRLSGIMRAEYTIASTTGLVNAEAKSWDSEVLRACGFPSGLFTEIAPPGTALGSLSRDIQAHVGFNAKIVPPCSHDTGSAVMAVPSAENSTLYISSGTWSLLGVERMEPDCSEQSMAGGFTNEGGYQYRYRYLRNIMGLWMIQSLKKELGGAYSFSELSELAEASDITSLVDCNDIRFLSPASMTEAVKDACSESGQAIPITPGELSAVIHNSLALCYRDSIQTLEGLTGINYPAVHIIGGGSANALLNRLTAQYTGKPVHAGPMEATAIGNILAQMLADGALPDLTAARECVMRSVQTQPEV